MEMKTFSVSICDADNKVLDTMAKNLGLSKASLVRWAIGVFVGRISSQAGSMEGAKNDNPVRS